MSWRGESKVAQVTTTFKPEHKGEKTETCHLGGDVGSREIFFWLCFMVCFLISLPVDLSCPSSLCLMPHGVEFLDCKQQKTTLLKLSKKGTCWKPAGSSEWKLTLEFPLGSSRQDTGDSRPGQQEPLCSFTLSRPQKEGFQLFVLRVPGSSNSGSHGSKSPLG